MKEKLSVVVPIYNGEKYLHQCINSILQQTYTNLEIILVDDGSTDSSVDICDLYADKDDRVSVIHKCNGGLISARREGVLSASANYVAFVDSDDWIAPDMYQKLMQFIIMYKTDIVVSGWKIYWSEEYMKLYQDDLLEEGFYDYNMMEKHVFPIMLWSQEKKGFGLGSAVWSKIFKKDKLLSQYKELEKEVFFYGEDVAVTYPYLLDTENMYITHEKYYYYRQKGIGVYSSCFSKEDYFEKLYALYSYLKRRFEDSRYKNILIRQLDYFYMSCVQKKKWGYNEKIEDSMQRFYFPFRRIPCDSRIVLYGAGEVGHQYYEQICALHYCEIVRWVDINYTKYSSEEISPIEDIVETEFDYIIIANASESISSEIKTSLLGMGIDGNKIV